VNYDSRRACCSTQDFAPLISQDVFSLQRVVLATYLDLSSAYWAKSQPNISRRGTRWLLGHRSEEIYALHSQQWRHIRLMKIGTNTALYFNCIVRQDFCWATSPLHLVQVLALLPDDITRRLKKPAFNLGTTITIRIETTPLITQESHSDYQHTSILTHSNSTTTIPWLCPPTTSKIVIAGCVCSPVPPCLWKFLQSQRVSPSSKTTTSVQ